MSRIKLILLVTAPVALLSMAACDGGGDDSPFCGHGCDPDDAINLPEGGEVRLELIKRGQGLGFDVRSTAWFASAQTPDSRPFVRDPKAWSTTQANPCTDMRSKTYFPSGVPQSRTYLDAGDTVSLSSAGAETTVLERVDDLQDYAFLNIFDIGYIASPSQADLTYNAEYDVNVSGSGALAATSLTTQRKLYLPSDYEVDFPDFSGTVAIDAEKELAVLWTDDAPDDPYLYGFVSFADALGLQYFCIGPNTGVMKIPPEVLADLTQTGFVQHGILSHRPVRFEGTTPVRRIDLIGISCNETRYTIEQQ